jgi:hypothetical protein
MLTDYSDEAHGLPPKVVIISKFFFVLVVLLFTIYTHCFFSIVR